VVGALRLGDDELATDELDGLAPEYAEAHEPLVLGSLPSPERERSLLHARRPLVTRGSITEAMGITVAAPQTSVNVGGWIRGGRCR
jgi:hypothetical protein